MITTREEREKLYDFAAENLGFLVLDSQLKIVRLLGLTFYMSGDNDYWMFDYEVQELTGEFTNIGIEVYPLKTLPDYDKIEEAFKASVEIFKDEVSL